MNDREVGFSLRLRDGSFASLASTAVRPPSCCDVILPDENSPKQKAVCTLLSICCSMCVYSFPLLLASTYLHKKKIVRERERERGVFKSIVCVQVRK